MSKLIGVVVMLVLAVAGSQALVQARTANPSTALRPGFVPAAQTTATDTATSGAATTDTSTAAAATDTSTSAAATDTSTAAAATDTSTAVATTAAATDTSTTAATAAATDTSSVAPTATASTGTLPNTGGDSSAFGLFLGLALVALLGGLLLQRRARYSK